MQSTARMMFGLHPNFWASFHGGRERFQLPKGFGDVADNKLDALVLVKLFHLPVVSSWKKKREIVIPSPLILNTPLETMV